MSKSEELIDEKNESSSETTPPKRKTKMVWRCKVCGHIEMGYPEGLPKGYRCPICNAPAKKFERIEIEV